MTRRCKDCLIKTGNKKVKELAETLSYAHTAFLIVQQEKILLEQKLEKIKEMCQNTLAIMNNDSGRNAYAMGRCIEAVNVLSIIEGAEDE